MRRILAYLRSGQGISGFALAALGWMLLVILEGAVVRATGSGAGCGKHWPLCNGEFIPHHPRVATVIEFAHRSVTAVCTGLVLALAAWTFLAQPPGHRARKAALWSIALLFTEGLLGAVLVLGGFVEHNTSDARVVVQCVHFTNTLLLLGALTLTWWWQRPRATPVAEGAPLPLRAAWLALGFTLLSGATGSVAALADTLFPSASLRSAIAADLASSSPLLIRMRWIHPASSLAAVAAIAVLSAVLSAGLGKVRARWLLGLVAAQVVLGVADVLALAPITLQLLHLLGADLLWIALVATAAQVLELAPSRATTSSSHSLSDSPLLADPLAVGRLRRGSASRRI